jgi:ubiquinone/menaquinone biosynthesis C-methylase UbiE
LGEPHSAAYFDEQRDFWWNRDFLRLVAARLGLARARSVLDVGAGLGHWARTLLAVLSPQATVVCVERDPRWVTQARKHARQLGLSDRFSFLEGVAEVLPCADQSFDLVTCQTLLIHVADPAAVVAEMRRVVRPGGTILLSEPNNLAGLLVADSATADTPVPELVERIEFALICERGKAAVGEGNGSVGDLLPGLLAQAGLIDIQSMLNDKTFALAPLYQSDDQQALRSVIIANADSDRWVWSRDDARRYFLAGGGLETEFEPRWQCRLDETRQTAQGLAAGRLHTAGGGIHYLISGQRPAE